MKNTARKWNAQTQSYSNYRLPQGSLLWDFWAKFNDDRLPVTCASCGKKITNGLVWQSWYIMDGNGRGYCVCSSCDTKSRYPYREEDGAA